MKLAITSITLLLLASTAAAQPDATPPPPDDATEEPPVAAEPEAVDVDTLRQEYLKLRDELFASRARAATVSSQLFSTKISLRLTWATGRYQGVSRALIRLDGASVYDDTDGAISGDDAVRFEGYIAPGRHVVTYRVEASGKDDDTFTSATESTIVIEATAGKDLVVAARAADNGDIAYQWQRSQGGTYRLVLNVDVSSRARAKGEVARAPGLRTARKPDQVAAVR